MVLAEKQLLVAFGTNQSFGEMPPEALIIAAAAAVSAQLSAEIRLSGLYRTPCFPVGAGPDYVNAAALLTLGHANSPGKSPEQVLQTLHAVEARFGRVRGARWASRTLDIDRLAMGQAVLPAEATHGQWRGLSPEAQARATPDRLILPHPRLQDRAFVLVPLADIAPLWRHPRLGQTVMQMLAALPRNDREDVRVSLDNRPPSGQITGSASDLIRTEG